MLVLPMVKFKDFRMDRLRNVATRYGFELNDRLMHLYLATSKYEAKVFNDPEAFRQAQLIGLSRIVLKGDIGDSSDVDWSIEEEQVVAHDRHNVLEILIYMPSSVGAPEVPLAVNPEKAL